MGNLHCWNIFCTVFIFSHFFIPFGHPLSFNITHFDHDGSTIAYEGDAGAAANGTVILNKGGSYGVGRATYAAGVHIWEDCLTGITHQADFTAHFSFTIDNVNASDGAGLAFFLAPFGYPIPPNSAGKGLGLFNATTEFDMSKNHIVAVVFDTSPSPKGGPLVQHVGIIKNSVRPVVSADWDANWHAGKTANVWITYNATTKNLSVFWTSEKNPVFKGNSSLSCRIDLKEVLPKRVTTGFSGATSSKLEQHVIRSWDFHSNPDSLEVSCNRIRRFRIYFVVFVVGCTLSLIILGGIISWFVLRRRNKNQRHGNDVDSDSSISTNLERGALPRKFSYIELVAGTNGFANDMRLGQGGSGQVYKGSLSGLGRPVAVKRIFTESKHSESLFINEVKIISRLIHRNLVQFIGWCHEQREFLLVYEYMPNCSLDNHLFGHGEILPWNARYKIALGLASALHYLHEEAEKYCVLHRDIKSANVLLDTDFSTKLGDFGVAELVDPQSRTHTTGVVGTYGYLAPEYANEGRASKESDMFSFGVVALEIACGRMTFHDGEYHVSLVTWVWELYLAGDILQAADERLCTSFSKEEMRCLLIVGLWCTNPNYRERPKAGQVIKVLQLEAVLPELPLDMHDPVLHPLLRNKGASDSFRPSITSSLKDHGR